MNCYGIYTLPAYPARLVYSCVFSYGNYEPDPQGIVTRLDRTTIPTFEELTLYFFIACGVGTGAFCMLFVLVTILFFKLRRMKVDGSNQLNRQTNMMADFCYTNPTIVPGEELSRRGFSMYSGSGHISSVDFGNKAKDYNTHHEARSKF